MILLLDKDEKFLGVIDNELPLAPNYWGDDHEESLENADVFYQFTMDAQHELSRHVVTENHVMFKNSQGELRLMRIKRTELDKKDGASLTVFTEHCAISDLNTGKPIPPQRLQGYTLSQVAELVLADLDWEVGRVDWSGTETFEFSDYITPLGALQTIKQVSVFDCDIVFRIEYDFNRNVIAGKYVDFVEQRGEETGHVLEYGRNIKGLRKVESSEELVTALVGVGMGDEEGSSITFKDVVWSVSKGDPVDKPAGQDWVGDPEAFQLWNDKGRHLFGIYQSESKTPEMLLEMTWNKLQKLKSKQFTYEVSAVVLRNKLGYDAKLGDGLYIKDTSGPIDIVLHARVIQENRCYSDPSGNSDSFIIGEYEEVILDDYEFLRKIQNKLRRKEGFWDSSGRIYRGPEPPTEFTSGTTWIDTSKTPNVPHTWNGTDWEKYSPTEAEEIGAETPEGAQDKADEAEEAAKEYTDGLISEINVDIANINHAIINKADIEDLNAVNAEIVNLKAEKADIGDLTAINAEIDSLKANKASIEDLTAVNAEITNLKATKASIEELEAVDAKITNLEVDTAIIKDAAITTAKIRDAAITTAKIQDASITGAKILDAEITTAKIADASITSAKIGVAEIKTANIEDAAITTAKIELAAITEALIEDAAITTAKIQDAAITNAQIAEATILEANIADAQITNAKIANLAVGTAKIQDAAITTAKIEFAAITEVLIEDAAITNAKIKNLAVDTAKIDNAAITAAKIADLQVTTAKIANLAVETAKIKDAAITTAKIGDLQVTNAKIGNAAITTAKIQDAAITNAKIGQAAILTANIADAQITTAKIAGLAVDSAKIKDAAITTAKIANGAITTALIGNGQITEAKIGDAQITDAKIVSITAAKITTGTLDTSKVTVQGVNGKLRIIGNRLQVFDNNSTPRERVAIGDVNGDGTVYGFRVRGANGTTVLYDENGVYNEGITDGAITNPKIGDDAVNSRVIAANAVTADHILAGTITGNEIAGRTITAAKLVANTITASSGVIADAAITTAKIADAAITNAKIDSIDAGKIKTGVLDAKVVRVGPDSMFEEGYDPTKIEIGGTNLVPKSRMDRLDGWDAWGDSTISVGTWTHGYNTFTGIMARRSPSPSGSIIGVRGAIGHKFKVEAGKTYTLSFVGAAGSNVGGVFDYLYLIRENSDNFAFQVTLNQTDFPVYMEMNGFNLYRIHYTFKVTFNDNVNVLIGSRTTINNSDAWIRVGYVQMEEGNKPTAWSPAISDIDRSDLVDGWQHGNTTYIAGGSIYTNSITANQIASRTITANEIKSNSITANEIAANTITASSGIIANAAITTAMIANAAVDTAKIKDASINNAKIEDLAVNTAKLADAAVTNAKIGTAAISTAKIADAQITNAKIANLAVDAAKIANLTITDGKIANGTITNASIKDATITTAKIANAAITSAKIADANITTAKIANAAITNAKIDSLDASKITTGVLEAARVRIGANTVFDSGYDPTKITVGGRNLASGTKGDSTDAWGWWSNTTLTLASYGGHRWIQVRNSASETSPTAVQTPVFDMKANATYVISFTIKSYYNLGYSLNYIYLRQGHSSTIKSLPTVEMGSNADRDFYGNISGDGLRVWFTFSHDEDVTGASILFGARLSAGAGFIVREVMIEEGTIPSDWRPSQEEQDTRNDLVDGWRYGNTVYIDGGNIYANSITANEIKSRTITANEIASRTITANEIKANAITANEINVTNLSSLSANLGTVTAGTLRSVTIEGATIKANSLFVSPVIRYDSTQAGSVRFEDEFGNQTAFFTGVGFFFQKKVEMIGSVPLSFDGLRSNGTSYKATIGLNEPSGELMYGFSGSGTFTHRFKDGLIYSEEGVSIGSDDSNNRTLIRFDIPRAWEFRQEGTGSTSGLELRSIIDSKNFSIKNASGNDVARFYASNQNGNRVTIGGDLYIDGMIKGHQTIDGHLTLTGNRILHFDRGRANNSTIYWNATASADYGMIHQVDGITAMKLLIREKGTINNSQLTLGKVSFKGLNGSIVQMQVRDEADNGYVPIVASEFVNGSARETKKNIEPYAKSALTEIMGLNAYMYHYKNDLDIEPKRLGLILDEAPMDVIDITGQGINIYALSTLAVQGVKELNQDYRTRMKKAEEEINWLKMENQLLLGRIKKLEALVS